MNKINTWANIIVKAIQENPFYILLTILVLILSAAISVPSNLTSLKKFYNSTIGRKAVAQQQISKLSASVNIGYFIEILGNPVFINTIRGSELLKENVFVKKYFAVQALTDADGTVLAYAVTSLNERFNPQFHFDSFTTEEKSIDIYLNKSNFIDLDSVFSAPDNINVSVGAHNFYYDESYYVGNPANYQSFVFALNENGPSKNLSLITDINTENPTIDDFQIKSFRSNNYINTIAITAPMVSPEDLKVFFGPDTTQFRSYPQR